MLQKILKAVGYILFALFFIAVGYYIGIANDLSFNFSRTISIVFNPSIIITIILAYYVTRILTKQNEKDKQEKILLIEYFKDFQKQLHNKCTEITDDRNFDHILCNTNLKFLRQKLYSFIKLAKQHNCISEDSNTDKLSQKTRDIWTILTDERYYSKDNGFKPEHKTLVNNLIIEMDELIFNVIFEINSH